MFKMPRTRITRDMVYTTPLHQLKRWRCSSLIDHERDLRRARSSLNTKTARREIPSSERRSRINTVMKEHRKTSQVLRQKGCPRRRKR